MKVLSLDQSSNKTGFAVFEDGELKIHNIIDLSKCKDLEMRINQMMVKINTLIEKIRPDAIVFEDVNFQSNVGTLTVLARLQGAIILSAIKHDINYEIYKPSHWRKILGFKQGKSVGREALKTQALSYIQDKYNIQTKEDIAEAICIGDAFLSVNKK